MSIVCRLTAVQGPGATMPAALSEMDRRAGDFVMSSNSDEEKVSGWLEPVRLDEMLAALRDTGFSGDAYRNGCPDLNMTLESGHAGAMHFLRHGYAESRVFAIALDPGGLERLRQLPVRNRTYLMN